MVSSCSTKDFKQSNESSCSKDRTPVNGLCVSYEIADYISCVRSRGGTIRKDNNRDFSIDVNYVAGVETGYKTSDSLSEEYPDSDENIKAIIRECKSIVMTSVDKTPIPDKEPLSISQSSVAKIKNDSVSSSFTGTSKESWGMIDGEMKNPGVGGENGGKNNGALIVTRDIPYKVSYFVAPKKYWGDWTNYSTLTFSMWSKGGRYFTHAEGKSYPDIVIYSGYSKAMKYLPERPPNSWREFLLLLEDDGSWSYEGGASRLSDILSNVTRVEIRAEYGAGEDISGLDNVMLD